MQTKEVNIDKMNDDEKYGDGATGGLSLEDRKRQKQEEMDRQ